MIQLNLTYQKKRITLYQKRLILYDRKIHEIILFHDKHVLCVDG